MKNTKYNCTDPQQVYEPVVVEVPFTVDPTKNDQLTTTAQFMLIKVLAIEAMYGCPVSQVDPAHVVDMLISVQFEKADD